MDDPPQLSLRQLRDRMPPRPHQPRLLGRLQRHRLPRDWRPPRFLHRLHILSAHQAVAL